MRKLLPVFFLLSLFLLFSNKAYASNILLSQDFTASNGTELSIYNGGWKARFDEVKNSYIYGNEVVDQSNNSGYYFTSLQNLSDICVSADFHSNWENDSWISIDTRRQGENDQLYLATIHKQDYYLGKNYSTVVPGTVPNGPLDSNWHHVKFCSIGHTHSLYLDDEFVNSFTDSSYATGYIGFDTAANMNFDNFVVSVPEVNISLNVPLLKQFDLSWKNKIYDSAKLWSPSDFKFGSWGCAVTSASMVFDYYGLKKLPNGTPLTPGTLNDWLKLQKDGYVGNGLVNWLALSRLSKLSISQNKISIFDALEFTKLVPGTLDLIKSDLVNSIPDILEQPGHFVVAKGINNGIVQINDPYYNRSSLADYGNTFISVNKFSPSHTDLSYILVVYSSDVTLQIKDSNHNYVGQYYEGAPIIDANNTSKNSGGPIMLYYVSKPSKDDYLLDVSSSVGSSKKLEIYLYDKAGNSFKYDKYLYLKNNETKTISLHYDPKSVGTGKATYGSLRKDLNFALRKKEIQADLYAYIISKSVIAETEQKLNKKRDELVTLTQMQENLDKSFGSKVFDPSYAKILNDINYLQTNL